MVNFRRTMMVGALLASVAGLASAQLVIDTKSTSYTAALVRNEGVTEAMPPVSFTITSSTAATTYDVTLISSAPITSTKAGLLFAGKAAATVAGNAATFSAVPFPAGASTFSLTGLRIDATQLPSLTSGQTTGLGENLIIVLSSSVGAPFTTPFDGTSPITTVTGLAYAVKSLGVVTENGTSSDGKSTAYTQCQTTPFDPTAAYTTHTPVATIPSSAFDVLLTEGFGSAWQTKDGEGVGATQATQISLTFSNVPANVTLYVPISYVDASVTLNLVSPAKPTLDKDKLRAAVPANGVVVYEVDAATGTGSTPQIPVYVSFNSGSVPVLTTSTAPITVTGIYVPQSTNSGVSGTTDLIPRFLGSAQVSHAVALNITPCNSTILFPYVVNTPGYDTGLAISNAGNLAADGGQSGTCQWSFFGDGAPTTDVAPTAAIDPGTTNTALLSALAPGLNGFAVASCNFEGGYGYAFIVGKLGGNEVAQGYLGLLSGQTGNFGFFPND